MTLLCSWALFPSQMVTLNDLWPLLFLNSTYDWCFIGLVFCILNLSIWHCTLEMRHYFGCFPHGENKLTCFYHHSVEIWFRSKIYNRIHSTFAALSIPTTAYGWTKDIRKLAINSTRVMRSIQILSAHLQPTSCLTSEVILHSHFSDIHGGVRFGAEIRPGSPLTAFIGALFGCLWVFLRLLRDLVGLFGNVRCFTDSVMAAGS